MKNRLELGKKSIQNIDFAFILSYTNKKRREKGDVGLKKNKTMLGITGASLILTVIIFIIHRWTYFGDWVLHGHHMSHTDVFVTPMVPSYYDTVAFIFFLIPLGIFLISSFLYLKSPTHAALPILLTLTLTLSSMAMIMGGDGMIEYHFSIFIVIALVSFYDEVKLIVIMASLFTLQHALGYSISPFTYFVFGVADYTITMTVVHIVAVVLMSVAIIVQIQTRQNLKVPTK